MVRNYKDLIQLFKFTNYFKKKELKTSKKQNKILFIFEYYYPVLLLCHFLDICFIHSSLFIVYVFFVLEYYHPHLYITYFASIEICEILQDMKSDIRYDMFYTNSHFGLMKNLLQITNLRSSSITNLRRYYKFITNLCRCYKSAHNCLLYAIFLKVHCSHDNRVN